MARQFELLSFGVLLVIAALVLVALYAAWIKLEEVLALIIALYGVWTIVLAGIRTKKPEKYGRGAYSTMVMGILLTALGSAWFLTSKGTDIIITIALLLVVIGILAVASALPSIRQK